MELSVGKRMSLVWGQGQDAPEAPAGIFLAMANSLAFRHRRREASASAPSKGKGPPCDSKRTGLASRPGERGAFTLDLSFSKLGYPHVTEWLSLFIF